MEAPKPSTLPFGVDRNSTMMQLFQALRAVREQRKYQSVTEDEDILLAHQAEELRDLIARKRDIFKRQKQTRRENEAADRLKQMGKKRPPWDLNFPLSS